MSEVTMWAQEREVRGVRTTPPGPSHDDSWGDGCPAPSLLGPHAGPQAQASCIVRETASAVLPGRPARSSNPGKLLLAVAFGSLLGRGFLTAPGSDFTARAPKASANFK